MKYFSTVAALVSLIPGIMSMTINTPTSVVQCQPQLISWADGMPPYYLTIIPGGQASAAPIKSFDTQSGTSITWIVDIPSGTSVTFALKDSTGATAYSDMATIQPGSDSSCLSGSSNSKPVATQATDATSSVVGSTGTGTGTTSRAAVAPSSAASRAVSTPSPVPATAQRTTSAAAPAGTSSTSKSSTSGAQSRFNVAGFAVAGALGLLCAIIL